MNRRQFTRRLAATTAATLLSDLPCPPPATAGGADETPSPVTAVDTHAHVFRRDLKLADAHRYAPDYDALPENYLRQLDAHGMSHGVLVQPSFLGTDNSYLLNALKAHPRRLRGIAVVEPTAGEDTLAELAQAGVVGVRLNLIGTALPDFAAGPWPDFLACLVALRWQVEVQREARDLPAVLPALLAAGLDVVVDHFGRVDPKLGIDDPGFRYLLRPETAGSRRLWVKLSGAYRNGSEGRGAEIARAAVPQLLAAFGPERLLWGSDWPFTQFERAADYDSVRAQLDAWVTDAAPRGVILADAPARLFRF